MAQKPFNAVMLKTLAPRLQPSDIKQGFGFWCELPRHTYVLGIETQVCRCSAQNEDLVT